MSTSVQKKETQGAVNLTVGNPVKKILFFALPLLIGNIFQLLYSWSDAIILGKVVGDEVAFTALSATLPVVNFLLIAVMGFMTGAAVVIGQYFGSKRFDDLKKAYSTLLISLVVLSVIFMIGGFFTAEFLLRLIRVNEKLIPQAASYIKVQFLGIFFMITYNIFAQVLRSLGNSMVPLFALIFCMLLNVAMDIVFALTTDLGIVGVALSTIFAQALSMVILFVYIQIKVPLLRIRKGTLVFDSKVLGRIMKIAVPSAIQNLCACLGFMIINALINVKSINFTTAFGLGTRIDELLNQVTTSFGVVITGFAAQNKGKGDTKRITQGFRCTFVIVAIFMAAACSTILPFKKQIISLFINLDGSEVLDMSEVQRLTEVMLNIYVPSFFFLAVMTITSGLLRGTGKATTAMSVNIFSLVARMVAAMLLFSSETGIILASPIGWLAGMVWSLGAYFTGGWKKNSTDYPSHDWDKDEPPEIAEACADEGMDSEKEVAAVKL